ncbi:DotI/IcmL/TraM family protein [Cysteiniphilum litorale]|uniref:DotI/IcmL/TraM family protein n=1 Tax=Cysteiniphilum litorale TaxID=2056700 RepID=UPI001473437C|nr:DotI/IcmL/TraM family protein [Cysteiniphilum litorale]
MTSKKILLSTAITMLISIIGIVIAIILIEKRNNVQYYLVTPQKNVVAIKTYNDPVIYGDMIIESFAKVVTRRMLTYDYGNVFLNLEKSFQDYFTPSGFENISQNALKQIKYIHQNKILSSITFLDEPKIVWWEANTDGYIWIVQLKILMTAYNVDTQRQAAYVITMAITKSPGMLNPDGLGVTGFYMSPII